MMNPVPLPGSGSGPSYDDTALKSRVKVVEDALPLKSDVQDLAATDNSVFDLVARQTTTEGYVGGLRSAKTVLERTVHYLDVGPASIRKTIGAAIAEARLIPRVSGARVQIDVTPGTYVEDLDLSGLGFVTIKPTVAPVAVIPSAITPGNGGSGRDWRATYTLTAAQAALYRAGDIVHVGVATGVSISADMARSLGPGVVTAVAATSIVVRHHAFSQPAYPAAADVRLWRMPIQLRTTKSIEVVASEMAVLDGVAICPNASSVSAPVFSAYPLIYLRSGAIMRLPPGDPLAVQSPSLVLCAGAQAIFPERGSRIVGGMLSAGGCSGVCLELFPGTEVDLLAAYLTSSSIGVRCAGARFVARRNVDVKESVIGGNQYEGVQVNMGMAEISGGHVVGNSPDMLALNGGQIRALAAWVSTETITPAANSPGANNGALIVR